MTRTNHSFGPPGAIRRAATPIALSAIALAVGVAQPASAVALKPGDFVVAGWVSTGYEPVVMKLDGTTLDSTRIATGFSGSLFDVVVSRSGRILLAVSSGVVEVDPRTGASSLVLSSSELGGTPRGICEGSLGDMFVSVAGADSRIVRWTPGGAITEVSAGGLLDNPGGLEVGGDGMLYVANTNSRTAHAWYGSILRVDPAGGAQVVVSEDPDLYGPFDLTFGPDGFIWTTNQGWIAGRNGCHVRTDPATGESAPAGTVYCRSTGVARGADGRMLLSDCSTIGPDCYMPILAFAGGPIEYAWLGGRVAVVPSVTTATRRPSWGQLKAIYR